LQPFGARVLRLSPSRCWGGNTVGQLGNGSTTTSLTPVAVSGGLSFATVSVGYESTCGVTTFGAAYCWGDNSYGALGNGSTTNSLTPVAVSGGLSFATVSVGSFYSRCGETTGGAAETTHGSSTPTRSWCSRRTAQHTGCPCGRRCKITTPPCSTSGDARSASIIAFGRTRKGAAL
jgi:hypothetical protein